MIIDGLYLCIPSFFPSPEQQKFFNESKRQSFTLSFDSWTTDRKPVTTGKIKSFRQKISIKYQRASISESCLSKAQRVNPARPPNQFNNAVFDTVVVKKNFFEIDGIR